jgi:hypothetical protein
MEESTPNAPRKRPRKGTPARETPEQVTPEQPAAPAAKAGRAKKTSAAASTSAADPRTATARTASTRTGAGTKPRAVEPIAATSSEPIVAPRPAAPVSTRPAEPARGLAPLWARIVADPGFVPEHLAREAVHRLGHDARDWVRQARDRYPEAGPDGLARLATVEYAKLARRQGAASGPAGLWGSMTASGIFAHTQARLVLTIAAIYGEDPASEDRVRDLLELLRVPRFTQPAPAALGNIGRLFAGLALRHAAARSLPFGAALATAVQGRRSIEDLAGRTVQHYRKSTRSRSRM